MRHLGVSELRKLRSLEDENGRLKRLIADLTLDKHMLDGGVENRGQGRALEDWAYQRGVQLDFIRPGKPVENAFIEVVQRAPA